MVCFSLFSAHLSYMRMSDRNSALPNIIIAPPGQRYETDALIIGAGPVGLFGVFELGLVDIKSHLIDTLAKPGGQCSELYPEKPIYDIPAYPVISGQKLTDQLLRQIMPFAPSFHLEQSADQLHRDEKGRWRLVTDRGSEIYAKVIVIAAGGGKFTPKKPNLPNLAEFEGKSVFFAIRRVEDFRDKHVVVAGGGDSALDWALGLQPMVRSLVLLHHRDGFRAAPDSVKKMRELTAAGKMALKIGHLRGLEGQQGQISALNIQSPQGETERIPTDRLLAFYGLTMRLGPIANFGLDLDRNLIPVDTARFETSQKSIFAIGDINSYPGKLKLILSGFHEAALMAQAAFSYIHPEQKLRFQYTTSASDIHKKLGVI